mgnify:CR=1 FL=1
MDQLELESEPELELERQVQLGYTEQPKQSKNAQTSRSMSLLGREREVLEEQEFRLLKEVGGNYVEMSNDA